MAQFKHENKAQFVELIKLVDVACDEVRQVSHNIAASMLNQFGLLTALENMKQAIESGNALKVSLVDVGFENRRLETSLEIAIYRIIQELVSNVLKHAQATELTLQLFWRKDGINVTVEDDGRGFDPAALSQKAGIGLVNIRGRVRALNGEFHIDSHPGKGTSVLIDIPL